MKFFKYYGTKFRDQEEVLSDEEEDDLVDRKISVENARLIPKKR